MKTVKSTKNVKNTKTTKVSAPVVKTVKGKSSKVSVPEVKTSKKTAAPAPVKKAKKVTTEERQVKILKRFIGRIEFLSKEEKVTMKERLEAIELEAIEKAIVAFLKPVKKSK